MVPAQDLGNVGLLDVLEQLPRDDLQRNIWTHLRNGDSISDDRLPGTHLGRPFRLISRASRSLADQLTRRLRLSLPRGDDREAFLSSQAGFLGRQEGLEHLILDGGGVGVMLNPAYDMEHFIVNTLVRERFPLGRSLRHLHTLEIDSPAASACSEAVGTAINRFCPRLQKLVLHVRDPAAALFTPLRSSPDLQKVDIAGNEAGALRSDTIRALAALPGLRALSLSGLMDPADASLLAGLTGLRQLCAAGVTFINAPAHEAGQLGSALGSLTQLTALDAPRWKSEGGGIINAIVAQLGSLTSLRELDFGGSGSQECVLDAAFGVLNRLTALTRLSCPAPSPLLPATSGHLLPLQDLWLRGCMDFPGLVSALRPVLPLPNLRRLRFGVGFPAGAGWAIGDADGAQAAAAWAAATTLAQAPRLEALHVLVFGDCWFGVPPDSQTAVGHASGMLSALLLPLRDALTCLELHSLSSGTFEASWSALCMAKRLSSLTLKDCDVPESRLVMAVGQHMASLEHLSVISCRLVSGSTAVALAGVRMAPLRITWVPAPDAEQCQQFQAAAQPGVTLDS